MTSTIIFKHNGDEVRRNEISMRKPNLSLLLDEVKSTIETYAIYVSFDTIEIKITEVK